MSKIEEKYNERTGQIEVYLNDRRIDTLENDQTNIELEILKNLIESTPECTDVDKKRNKILRMISNHLGDGNNSLISIKDVLVDIYNKIGEGGGSSEEIEKVKRELLLLIHLLDKKIEESKLVAGEGILIEGNVISTTGSSYIEKLISDYEKLKQEYDELLAKNIQLEGQVSVLNNRLEQCSKENQRLTNELKQITIQYEKSLVEIAKLNSEIQRLEEIIASGEDYKLYKKYQQLYYRAEAEAAKYKKELDELTRVKKWEKSRDKELIQIQNNCNCCC